VSRISRKTHKFSVNSRLFCPQKTISCYRILFSTNAFLRKNGNRFFSELKTHKKGKKERKIKQGMKKQNGRRGKRNDATKLFSHIFVS